LVRKSKQGKLVARLQKSDREVIQQVKTKRFMRVQDLQLFLSQFTKGSDAIKNAQIYVERDGKLYQIRRMEVHEHNVPIVGQPGQTAHRLVLKTQKPSSLILPDKLQKDY